jgi:triosephosphate isomerase (TIM)
MTKIIVANWKMNGSRDFIENFFKNFPHKPQNKIIFCPPFPYISLVKEHTPLVGGQDCSSHPSGAYTGETSAAMLVDLNCSHVIVGHSERRSNHRETNQIVRAKAEQALQVGLIPIICVGESKECRDSNQAIDFVLQQLDQSLPLVLPQNKIYYVAYEPVWAIGTGLTATSEDITTLHRAIYGALPDKTVSILYGGSVTKETAPTILALPHVDGVLVGGASLKLSDFIPIATQTS